MKKIIIFIICIVIIIIAMFSMKYIEYRNEQSAIEEENLEYEVYLEKEITGTELTSVIDKAVDNNERNNVEKDENGLYIDDDENSIKIEIIMLDDEGNTYQMETIYSGGMSTFINYYNDITFKCTDIKYNSLGKVNYLLFEQVTV